jgi:hypothetical protein
MDSTTLNALITGGAGLFGTLVGGGTAYMTGAGQHRRQVKKERRDLLREREHQTAKECELLCLQMADYMESVPHPASRRDDKIADRGGKVAAAHKQLESITLYLPDDLRDRVEKIGDILASADDLSYGSSMGRICHYHQPYTICWHLRREVRAVIAAFLKDEKLPKRSKFVVEYEAAVDDLNADREEHYSYYEELSEGQAERRNRDEFYDRHPKLRPNESE